MARDAHFRQFVIIDSNSEYDAPVGWLEQDLGSVRLYYHPDLDCERVDRGDDSAILLGFAYNGEVPTSKDNMLLSLLLSDQATLDQFDTWGGVYVVFLKVGGLLEIHNDAAACGKVYFGFVGGVRCAASDTLLLERVAPLKPIPDPQAQEVLHSKWFTERHRRWIGATTNFQHVSQLTANHYLQWKELKTVRAFPRKRRTHCSLDEAVDRLHQMLQAFIGQAVDGHRVRLGLTAGLDSRVLLAAARPYRERIACCTYRRRDFAGHHADVEMASEICRKLALTHEVVDFGLKLPPEDLAPFNQSFHWKYASEVAHHFTLYPEWDAEQMFIVGSVAEVGKCYLERMPISNGKTIARALHMPDHPYIHGYWQSWYDRSAELLRNLEYEPIDFVHWEQDITNFAGAGNQYINHVVKCYPVFNCRRVLELMLSVEPKYRDHHRSRFHLRCSEKWWPDLASCDVNPTMRSKAILGLKRIGVYKVYKWIRTRFVPLPLS